MIKNFNLENREIKDRLVAKNNLAFALLTYMPIVPGHSLICPIRIVEASSGLTQEEWQSIIDLKYSLCTALKRVFQADGFNFAWNEGVSAGQSVPHFHLHVVPRTNGDTGVWQYDPRIFLYRPGSRAISPADELNEIASLIRQQLN